MPVPAVATVLILTSTSGPAAVFTGHIPSTLATPGPETTGLTLADTAPWLSDRLDDGPCALDPVTGDLEPHRVRWSVVPEAAGEASTLAAEDR